MGVQKEGYSPGNGILHISGPMTADVQGTEPVSDLTHDQSLEDIVPLIQVDGPRKVVLSNNISPAHVLAEMHRDANARERDVDLCMPIVERRVIAGMREDNTWVIYDPLQRKVLGIGKTQGNALENAKANTWDSKTKSFK